MMDDDPKFFEEVATEPKPNGHAQPGRNIDILYFEQLLTPDLETKGLVKGLIGGDSVVLAAGPPGCGKTFLILDLALSVADGREWFGHKTKRGRVVYVAAEAGKSIRNRVVAWANEKWDERAKLDFRAVTSPVDLCHLEKGDARRLAETIGHGGADLVVIDTVSRALAGGDENAPSDMGAFIHVMDKLRAYLGCAIIAVHHIGKDASRGARGHSSLLCAVDTEIMIEKRDDVSVATVTKQRDLPSGAEIAFLLRPVELGRDQDGDAVTSCVVEAAEYVPEKKSKEPTGQAKAALDVLNQTVAEKGATVPFGDLAVRAVKVEEWREAMERSALFGEGAQFRNAWMRARGRLADDGHVAFGDGYVWPTKREEGMLF